ncbi:MAG: hypothetical protein HPY61_04550 [Methanotrichaceae archaeon]|nr:hypothetical protein [Methanotrichaceae archaeon]
MSEGTQAEYFKKPGTSAPSMAIDLEPLIPTEASTNVIVTTGDSLPTEDLINQNIIKVNDYRKNKATRRVIAHVPFKPD